MCYNWEMDTGTILLVAVILIGLLLVVVLRNRRSRDISFSQPTNYSLPPSSFHVIPTPLDPDADIQQIALYFISRGQKLEAIKHVRQVSGWDLKAAKDYVEALESGAIPSAPSMSASVASVSPELRASLLDLVNNRRKVEAIKMLRAHTGLGLKEAKDYVESLDVAVTPPAPFRVEPAEFVSEEVRDAALALIQAGRKIEAIKMVREHTNWGLKGAKDWVDAVESDPMYRAD